MLITKALKLVIVCAEFEIIIYPEVFYIYLILRLVSPEGDRTNFFMKPSRILGNTAFSGFQDFRIFGKHKAKEIKVEHLRYNNFPFLEIKTL